MRMLRTRTIFGLEPGVGLAGEQEDNRIRQLVGFAARRRVRIDCVDPVKREVDVVLGDAFTTVLHGIRDALGRRR
jgi:hypothetical protein